MNLPDLPERIETEEEHEQYMKLYDKIWELLEKFDNRYYNVPVKEDESDGDL